MQALRRLGLLLVLALSVASAVSLPDTELNFSTKPLMEGEAESLEKLKRFQAEVPPDLYDHVCIISWPHRIGQGELSRLEELHEARVADTRVRSVVSLATVPVLGPGDILCCTVD